MLATNLEYDRHFGRIMTGKIYAGKIKVGDKLKTLSRTGKVIEEGKVLNIMARRGLEKIKIEEAYAGEIVSIAGLSKTSVTDTICSLDNSDSIPVRLQSSNLKFRRRNWILLLFLLCLVPMIHHWPAKTVNMCHLSRFAIVCSKKVLGTLCCSQLFFR